MRLPWRTRRDREADLRAELDMHLRMAVAERVARGESPAEAEHAARRELGNDVLVGEVTREVWGGMWLDRLWRDVRYGARGLRRSPGFAFAAILTLALGVGANTSVFTVVHSVLLRPLPFREPEQLFLISHMAQRPLFEMPPSMYEEAYLQLHREQRAFEHVASFARTQLTLTGVGEPARLSAATVTADFMSVLGVNAALGRTFAPDEDTKGNERVVLLSDRLWRARFAASSGVLGQAIQLNGVAHTVVGVMPASFSFPHDVELWVPMVSELSANNTWMRPVVARMKPGITQQQALSDVERAIAGFEPPPNHALILRLVPLKRFLTGDAQKSLLLFAGAVAFVLLIACANVANLLLTRGAARKHEIVVRAALGASRGRIIRLLLTESAVVALLGGIAGVVLSFWGVRGLLAIAPPGRIPRVEEIHLDGVVLAVSLGATLLAGLLFGLAPALAITRQQLRSAVGEAARTLGGGHERLRRSLAIAEIAFAIVLLTGAGLLLRSFQRIRAIDPGFEPNNVVAMSLNLPGSDYPDAGSMHVFHSALLEKLGSIPGVQSTGAVNWAPFTPMLIRGDIRIEGVAEMPSDYVVHKMSTTPGYFRALGVELLYGRELTPQDDARAAGVVVISESVAKRFWPPDGAAAIGRRLTNAEDPKPEDWLTIVGVVADVTQQDLMEERGGAIYAPLLQTTRTFFLEDMTFVLRTARVAGDIMPAMRAAVWDLDPNLPIPTLAAMDDIVVGTISEPRFEARLLTIFSLLALLLAAIGTYGVLAHDVTSRTHEIGLRVALGAKRGDVARLVLTRVLIVAVPGILLGIGGALAVTRVLTTSLYQVQPSDPLTLGAVSALLFAVALLAAVVPTRRATRVDPLIALRQE